MIRIGSPLKTRIQEVRIGEVHSITIIHYVVIKYYQLS